jgi:hypothetical protein
MRFDLPPCPHQLNRPPDLVTAAAPLFSTISQMPQTLPTQEQASGAVGRDSNLSGRILQDGSVLVVGGTKAVHQAHSLLPKSIGNETQERKEPSKMRPLSTDHPKSDTGRTQNESKRWLETGNRLKVHEYLGFWLPPRDSNPDMLIQSQLSYH